MPSPFPGMDPFIESQRWGGFHHRFIAQLGDMLVAQLRPRYEVEPEERVYVETSQPDWSSYRADVAIFQGDDSNAAQHRARAGLDLAPLTITLPIPVEEKESYLVLRQTGSREVVAVIELLSPTNKRPGSDGRREYLAKRSQLFCTRAHLVELDLLLGGARLPIAESFQAETSYCAIVSRAETRPRAELFEWPIRRSLPRIPVPLANGDPDAVLDLQTALNVVYERAGYDYSLHYDQPLELPLPGADEGWLQSLLAARRAG